MQAYAMVAAMIAAAVVGNILLKRGAVISAGGSLAALINGHVLAGLILFAAAAVLYLVVLRRFPLNVAQSFMTAQFIGVILASHFVLGEALPGLRIAGIALITAGLMLVALSQH